MTLHFKDMLSDSKANVSQQMVNVYAHYSSHHTTLLNQNYCNQTHEDEKKSVPTNFRNPVKLLLEETET